MAAFRPDARRYARHAFRRAGMRCFAAAGRYPVANLQCGGFSAASERAIRSLQERSAVEWRRRGHLDLPGWPTVGRASFEDTARWGLERGLERGFRMCYVRGPGEGPWCCVRGRAKRCVCAARDG